MRKYLFLYSITLAAPLMWSATALAQYCVSTGQQARLANDVASLVWTGHLDGGLQERDPKEISNAVQRFRLANGAIAASGDLTAPERLVLCKAAESARSSFGIVDGFVDEKTGIKLTFPGALLWNTAPHKKPIRNGNSWVSADREFELGVQWFPTETHTAAAQFKRHKELQGRTIIWQATKLHADGSLMSFSIEADDYRIVDQNARAYRVAVHGEEGIAPDGAKVIRMKYLEFPREKLSKYNPLANVIGSSKSLFHVAVQSSSSPLPPAASLPPELPATGAPAVKADLPAAAKPQIDCNERRPTEAVTNSGQTMRGSWLFVGTDRSLSPGLDGRPPQWGVAGPGGELRLARTRSWVPNPLPRNNSTMPLIDPIMDVVSSEFDASLGCAVQQAARKAVLVYVHGYNNTEIDAARTLSEVGLDLEFAGVAAMFTWRSAGKAGAFDAASKYRADADRVQSASVPLEKFLKQVAAAGVFDGGKRPRITILAHSMGNRPLLDALVALKRSGSLRAMGIEQVVFSAPDVEASAFVTKMKELEGSGPWFTLYASSADRALFLSERYNSGTRAGSVVSHPGTSDPRPVLAKGLFSFDVSDLADRGATLDHSPHKVALVAKHLRLLIEKGGAPDQALRDTGELSDMRTNTPGSEPHWIFRRPARQR